MAVVRVRRVGRSLVLPVPKQEAAELDLREGDTVHVEIHKIPSLLDLAGSLKGRVSAATLNESTDEDEGDG